MIVSAFFAFILFRFLDRMGSETTAFASCSLYVYFEVLIPGLITLLWFYLAALPLVLKLIWKPESPPDYQFALSRSTLKFVTIVKAAYP